MDRNLFFDFFDVLFNGMDGRNAMGRLVEQRIGISRDEYRMKDYDECWELWKLLNRGELSEVGYWEKILEKYKWDATPEDFMWCTRQALKIQIPGTYDILSELYRGSYNLFLVSDIWADMRDEMIKAYPWIKVFFKKCYFSCDFHSIKSDEGYFEKICADAGVKPSDSIMIDDYDVNIMRAKSAGMDGIIFENANQLRRELYEKLGTNCFTERSSEIRRIAENSSME